MIIISDREILKSITYHDFFIIILFATCEIFDFESYIIKEVVLIGHLGRLELVFHSLVGVIYDADEDVHRDEEHHEGEEAEHERAHNGLHLAELDERHFSCNFRDFAKLIIKTQIEYILKLELNRHSLNTDQKCEERICGFQECAVII